MSGTAGFNFSSTTIRSAEVNQNFEWVRGHYLPLTQSGTWANTTGVYDVGSSSYKFRDGYFAGSITAVGYNQPNGETIRILRGVVDGASGSITAGSGFTAARSATGIYTISASTAFLAGTDASCVVTAAGSTSTSPEVNASVVNASWTVRTKNTGGVATDCSFHFIVIGQP